MEFKNLKSLWTRLHVRRTPADGASAVLVLQGTKELDHEVVSKLQEAVTISDDATVQMLGRTSDLHQQSSQLIQYLMQAREQSDAMQGGIERNSQIIAELAAFVEQLPLQIAEEREQTQRVVGEVKQLGDAAESIRQMARQTEILAINAAIEAARAGQAGKGFSVLAAEVRRLATESTESAARIEQRISSLLDAVAATQKGEIAQRAERTESESRRLAGLTRQLDDSYVDMRQFYQMLMDAVTRHNGQMDVQIAGLVEAGQYQDLFKQIIDRTQPALDERHALMEALVQRLADGADATDLAEEASTLVAKYRDSESRHRNPLEVPIDAGGVDFF